MTTLKFEIFEPSDTNFEEGVKKANTVWLLSFGNSYGEYECPADVLVTAEVDGCVITAFILCEEYDGSYKLSCLGTSPEHQKRGYASEALEKAKQIVKSKGLPSLSLNVDFDESDKLLPFYEKRGFYRIEEQDAYEYVLVCVL